MPTLSAATAWLPGFRPLAGAHTRVFCFPFAGGGSHVFREFGRRLAGQGIEVCAVQIPRVYTPGAAQPFDSIEHVADQVVHALDSMLEGSFALLGYSLGGYVAWEVARVLREAGRPQPQHMFLLSCSAPGTNRKREPLHQLEGSAFQRKVEQLYGPLPEAVRTEPELLDVFLPILRADLRLFETYSARPHPPLACDFSAVVGRDDPVVDAAWVEPWRQRSSGSFEAHHLAAGHFVLNDQLDFIVDMVAARVSADHHST